MKLKVTKEQIEFHEGMPCLNLETYKAITNVTDKDETQDRFDALMVDDGMREAIRDVSNGSLEYFELELTTKTSRETVSLLCKDNR